MSAYDNMSDEDKILLSIRFVARGQRIPTALRTFLKEQGLLAKITMEGTDAN